MQRGAIEQQLAAGNLVMLTNIGVSSSGELLNCNAFDVSIAHELHMARTAAVACCHCQASGAFWGFGGWGLAWPGLACCSAH